MNLWVRSQDRRILQKVVNDVYISVTDDKTIKTSDRGVGIELGTYKTKERALEVLDEIQNKINLINLGYDFGSPMIDLKNPTYIYQMPEN